MLYNLIFGLILLIAILNVNILVLIWGVYNIKDILQKQLTNKETR